MGGRLTPMASDVNPVRRAMHDKPRAIDPINSGAARCNPNREGDAALLATADDTSAVYALAPRRRGCTQRLCSPVHRDCPMDEVDLFADLRVNTRSAAALPRVLRYQRAAPRLSPQLRARLSCPRSLNGDGAVPVSVGADPSDNGCAPARLLGAAAVKRVAPT